MSAGLASLEKRLARLEAAEDIRTLVSRFARAADHHCDPAMIRPLFADDAVFEVGTLEFYRGVDEIVARMAENNKTGFYWTIHYLVGPEIAVADDCLSAEAFYYLWEPASTQGNSRRPAQAYWIGGWYDATLTRDEDGWKFRRLRLTIKLMSGYEEGWKAMPKSLAEL